MMRFRQQVRHREVSMIRGFVRLIEPRRRLPHPFARVPQLKAPDPDPDRAP
ncbi:MAG TPA: hypothetical protein VNA31_02850 [bacterium]|nr:hypothetical protein [bacterium]